MKKTVALLGNPNSGKTLLFNSLTGASQKVANFPGVTIEKKTGIIKENGMYITDLPGIYSLSPYFMEEVLSLDYILDENPDIILNIVDGTNIERNLYLTLQLLELGKPMVVAVNMIDDLQEQGTVIDYDSLSQKLGVAVVPVSAKKGINIDRLVAALNQCETPAPSPAYEEKTENCKNAIIGLLPSTQYKAFLAMKLIEQDERIRSFLKLPADTERQIDKIIDGFISSVENYDKETFIPGVRYEFIDRIVAETVKKRNPKEESISDKIDKIVTNKILAIPIFILIMFTIFQITFGDFGTFFQDKINWFIDEVVVGNLQILFERHNAPAWTSGLIIDGVIEGVGGIISFMPQIIILFILLTLLEDTGYMSRVAFIMDRIMKKIGLSGKSFIPMLMGFGCTTPAVMATRTMQNEMDRKMTIMLTPFMSCSARLPIYVLFAGIFFKSHQGLIVSLMYLIGILTAIASGLVLKHTVFKGVFSPFVIEMPKYRIPSLKSVLFETWEKAKGFLIKAGTIIFSMSVILWLLQNFSPDFCFIENSEESIIGYIGKLIAPVFAPLGFGSWQAAVSILSGLVAKEVIVSSITILFAGTGSVDAAIAAHFTPASAFSFMVFSLLYTSCISAFVTIKRELGSWKSAFGTAVFQTGVAYIVAFIFYHAINLLKIV